MTTSQLMKSLLNITTDGNDDQDVQITVYQVSRDEAERVVDTIQESLSELVENTDKALRYSTLEVRERSRTAAEIILGDDDTSALTPLLGDAYEFIKSNVMEELDDEAELDTFVNYDQFITLRSSKSNCDKPFLKRIMNAVPAVMSNDSTGEYLVIM